MNNVDFKDLDKIINEKHIKTVFQPIISLSDGEIHGYEALSRVTCESNLANPADLFQAASETDRLWELEWLCHSIALHTAGSSGVFSTNMRLFLNISPSSLTHSQFHHSFTKHYLREYGISPEQVVFEITERNQITDLDTFRKMIGIFKAEHFHIAIDDAGAMFSGLNLINEIHPHYIKLDRRLIHHVDVGQVNFALIKGMVEFCHTSNIPLIAEGVETESELMILIDLDVPFVQGYFLRRPDEQCQDIPESIKELILGRHRLNRVLYGNSGSGSYISNICTPTETIPKDMPVEDIFNKMKADPDSFGVCVTEDDRVIGILTKSNLTLKLSGRFGFSLYQNHPVSLVMDTDFISVDYRTPINEVSKVAMSRPQEKLYDFIVVTKDERYLGTVTIKNLLQKATEIEVVKAKYENPLTGLPGNLIIEQKMEHCLSENKAFAVLYLDINHFKEYNDVYGFENGDCVIKLLADILVKHLPLDRFVGHVGGDDFVAILDPDDVKAFCHEANSEFCSKVQLFYNSVDKKNGYIITENRLGVTEKFAILSVSIAGIITDGKKFSNQLELTEKLAKLKKKSKKMKEDHLLLIHV